MKDGFGVIDLHNFLPLVCFLNRSYYEAQIGRNSMAWPVVVYTCLNPFVLCCHLLAFVLKLFLNASS